MSNIPIEFQKLYLGKLFCSVTKSRLILCDLPRLLLDGFPCPSGSLGVCSNSCPLSQWCHPNISSSVIPFSSHLQSLPASGSFPMSQLFKLGDQIIGASASASVLPMNIQAWSPLVLTGLSYCCTRDSKASSPAPHFQSINSSAFRLLNYPTLRFIHDDLKNHNIDYRDFCWQSNVSPF